MELKVKEITLPEAIEFNYQELKKELEEKVSVYSTMVYTDDTIQEAKKDKANLNKLKKALNDERIRREKEYMQPFNAFKSQVNEIIAIIDKPVAVIDKQVKDYEDKQKQDKYKKINEYFEERYLNSGTPAPDFFTLDRIFDEKWLNASVSMKSIQSEIDAKAEKVKNDLSTLENLPEFGFEATEVYKSTLDINKAIAEGHRLSEIQKRKAEHEAEQARLKAEAEFAKNMNQPVVPESIQNAEPNTDVIEPAKTWVKFAALMTVDQARELKRFFDDRSIEFKAV